MVAKFSVLEWLGNQLHFIQIMVLMAVLWHDIACLIGKKGQSFVIGDI